MRRWNASASASECSSADSSLTVKPQPRRRSQVVPMGFGHPRAGLAHRVGEQRQRAAGGDGGIELAQAARRGVAGVGEQPVPGGFLRGVQRQEIGLGHEHLAADFDQRGCRALQRLRHRGDGAEIGGDVLALGAVAARRPEGQRAALVGEVDGQPVDLRLGDDGQGRVGGQAEEAAGAGVEFDEILGREGVVERQHRHRCAAAWRSRRLARRRPGGRASRPAPGRETAPRSRCCAGAGRRIRRR